MKIGLGFHRKMPTPDSLRFSVQAGATLVVVHRTNRGAGRDPKSHGGDPGAGWGDRSDDTFWACEDLFALVQALKADGRKLAALKNHTPEMTCDASWHAGKAFALGYMKALVRNAQALGPARRVAVAAE